MIDKVPENGYHARVRPGSTISALTQIATCPMICTLSVLSSMDVDPFYSRGTKFPVEFLRNQSPTIVQSFFLMEQFLLGDESWWSSYIGMLPTPEDIEKLEFDDIDMKWIEGTNLKYALAKQTEQWQADFNSGLQYLNSLGWRQALRGDYTWKLYGWASRIFGSRSFSCQVLADSLAADQASPIGRGQLHHRELKQLFSNGFAVLLPLLDLLNHRPLSKVEWQARTNYVGLEVLDECASDQEIFNNYGPRDNETLLLSYSFIIPENHFDHFSVALKVPPDSPLEHVRSWPADARSDPDRKCYIFNPLHPRTNTPDSVEFTLFSFDLLDSISILAANDRELQISFAAHQTWMSYGLQYEFEDCRNVLATVSQILQECKARLEILRRTTPADQPQTVRQRNADAYRKSQISILSTAISLCTHILRRARIGATSIQNVDIDIAVAKLLRSHPYITRPGELHTPTSLIDMLPVSLARSIQQIVASVGDAFLSEGHSPLVDHNKACFAVILGVLQLREALPKDLSDHLKSWLPVIRQRYPVTDPNWSYVPSDPPDPDYPPPPALLKLLDTIKSMATAIRPILNTAHAVSGALEPSAVCWGWNVMEEEGVVVTIDEDHREPGIGDREFLLYIPMP